MASDTGTKRSRRALLAAAAGAAAATAVGALARPLPALAAGDDGSVIHVGDTYLDVQTTTTLKNTANSHWVMTLKSDMGTALLVGGFGEAGIGIDAESDYGQAVHADTGYGQGVWAHSSYGDAIQATSDSFSASGVWGDNTSTGFGVSGSNHDLNGIGVWGYNTTNGRGAVGSSVGGTGVIGVSVPSNVPFALPIGTRKTGVFGQCDDGRGGVFQGNIAQLKLVPSSAKVHPNSGQKGDFFVDSSGRLWFCKGTTTWVRLA